MPSSAFLLTSVYTSKAATRARACWSRLKTIFNEQDKLLVDLDELRPEIGKVSVGLGEGVQDPRLCGEILFDEVLGHFVLLQLRVKQRLTNPSKGSSNLRIGALVSEESLRDVVPLQFILESKH